MSNFEPLIKLSIIKHWLIEETTPPPPRPACPECGANRTLPIAYGLPVFEPPPQPEERDFVLGGCFLEFDSLNCYCKECEHRWG